VSLIGSDKVESTAVYGGDEKKIGNVQRVMIDKVSGKVAYAVISFGGFFGMGEDYYPMPWTSLRYDNNLGEHALREHLGANPIFPCCGTPPPRRCRSIIFLQLLRFAR